MWNNPQTRWDDGQVFIGCAGGIDTLAKMHYVPEPVEQEAKEGQSYECFPDIPFEQIMTALFRAKGIDENADALGKNAAQLFRICSLDYVNLYPGVLEALKALRQQGYRLWLLSNAQRVFTEYELRQHKAKVLLGSATPSLESYFNAKQGRYGLVELTHRHGAAVLPEIEIVDTKLERRKKLMKQCFSQTLLSSIDNALSKDEQVILFQNRRGLLFVR